MRSHDLRHTCATLLLAKGMIPKFVPELIGHADVGVTPNTHSHYPPSIGKQTALAMKGAVG